MMRLKGCILGEDAYGNVVKKIVNASVDNAPEGEMYSLLCGIVNLCNIKVALIDIYEKNKKNKLDSFEFMSDDIDSCEADEVMRLMA
jgi:hypothetical protein